MSSSIYFWVAVIYFSQITFRWLRTADGTPEVIQQGQCGGNASTWHHFSFLIVWLQLNELLWAWPNERFKWLTKDICIIKMPVLNITNHYTPVRFHKSLNTASSVPACAWDCLWCSCHIWTWSQPKNQSSFASNSCYSVLGVHVQYGSTTGGRGVTE